MSQHATHYVPPLTPARLAAYWGSLWGDLHAMHEVAHRTGEDFDAWYDGPAGVRYRRILETLDEYGHCGDASEAAVRSALDDRSLMVRVATRIRLRGSGVFAVRSIPVPGCPHCAVVAARTSVGAAHLAAMDEVAEADEVRAGSTRRGPRRRR